MSQSLKTVFRNRLRSLSVSVNNAMALWSGLWQWFPNLFEPLPKPRQRLCLITRNISHWSLIIQNNIVVLVLRYPPKNRILPPGGNWPPVWKPLGYVNVIIKASFCNFFDFYVQLFTAIFIKYCAKCKSVIKKRYYKTISVSSIFFDCMKKSYMTD